MNKIKWKNSVAKSKYAWKNWLATGKEKYLKMIWREYVNQGEMKDLIFG